MNEAESEKRKGVEIVSVQLFLQRGIVGHLSVSALCVSLSFLVSLS